MSTLTPSTVAELDRSNVVDIDLGSVESKANAHRHMADWAKRRPFYVLGSGPPQVVVGRYADVHKVFSDTETFASEMPRGPGWEQFNKIMAACPRPPPVDAGVLLAADRAVPDQHHGDRRWHARWDRKERPRVRRHERYRRASGG
ncbi:MAG: hypothetical protein NTV56_16865 [Alphaproteobacteria bacterium]|nr:hypothetical protein [Alphaproteobacteria bacterium]